MCRLELAVALARSGELHRSASACGAIGGETWKDECHFLVAEIISRHQGLATALPHCDQAGHFRGFCIAHLAWWAQEFPSLSSPADPQAGAKIDRFLASLPITEAKPRWSETEGMFRASAWFTTYYGAGSADPTAAKSAVSTNQADAHTAFAWEATRLIAANEGWTDLPAKVAAVWDGSRPAPTGTPMVPRCWRGRIPDVTHTPAITGGRALHTVHGGSRLQGETPTEDLSIATLEAIFFQSDAPASLWAGFVDKGTLKVRATAARLGMMAEADDPAWRAQMAQMKDPLLREQLLAARNHPANLWQASPLREGCP
jgi:hypothetical protein